jgi:hypothetical protein
MARGGVATMLFMKDLGVLEHVGVDGESVSRFQWLD